MKYTYPLKENNGRGFVRNLAVKESKMNSSYVVMQRIHWIPTF